MKQKIVHVDAKDLPLSCPPKNAETSGSHPKIYLKMDEDGQASCQYCGAKYSLDAK